MRSWKGSRKTLNIILNTTVVEINQEEEKIKEIFGSLYDYEEFIEAVSWKSSKSKRTFPEKILRAYEEISVGNFLLMPL